MDCQVAPARLAREKTDEARTSERGSQAPRTTAGTGDYRRGFAGPRGRPRRRVVAPQLARHVTCRCLRHAPRRGREQRGCSADQHHGEPSFHGRDEWDRGYGSPPRAPRRNAHWSHRRSLAEGGASTPVARRCVQLEPDGSCVRISSGCLPRRPGDWPSGRSRLYRCHGCIRGCQCCLGPASRGSRQRRRCRVGLGTHGARAAELCGLRLGWLRARGALRPCRHRGRTWVGNSPRRRSLCVLRHHEDAPGLPAPQRPSRFQPGDGALG